ncbi:MAG: Smr/MutS family protein [Desulfomonilia bacterium]
MNDDAYHELVVDDTLDLHMFSPRDIKELVPDYLKECREKGILYVRIVHGKGTGTLRRIVHSLLSTMPEVESFRLAGGLEGGWGATIVELKPSGQDPSDNT